MLVNGCFMHFVLGRRLVSSRKAFTLIELLVVVLIIAILLAVALPSFLGHTNAAYNSAVEQQLTNTRIEAKAVWTSAGQTGFPYTATASTPDAQTVSELRASEPGYNFVADPYIDAPNGNSPQASQTAIGIDVDPADTNIITACGESKSDIYFCWRSDETSNLLAIPGYNNVDAPAASSMQSVLAPTSADADTAATTDLVRASGNSESAAVCVLNDATPASAGGSWSTDWSACAAEGGEIGWSTPPQPTAGGGAPVNLTLPSISGSPSDGATETASVGTWSQSPTSFSFQWLLCPTTLGIGCVTISGATADTYVVAGADVGSYLEVEVTASNAVGSGTATSQPTAQIGAATGNTGSPPGNITAPAISGQPYANYSTLIGTSGTWSNSPSSYTYQWLRCTDQLGQNCASIPGATVPVYSPVTADIGDYIELQVTAWNTYGSASATSQPTNEVMSMVPANTSVPAISGQPYGTVTLTASPGSWTNSPTGYGYQWETCTDATMDSCSAISKAYGTTFTVSTSDEGDYIAVVVRASNAYGQSSASSGPTLIYGPPQFYWPVIASASPVYDGTTVSTTQGGWRNYPTSYSYQWVSCSAACTTANDTAISGATSSSFTASSQENDEYIAALVTASNPAGSRSALSNSLYVNGPPQVVAAPAISLTSQLVNNSNCTGCNLAYTDGGSWSNAPTSTSYQWYDCPSASSDPAAGQCSAPQVIDGYDSNSTSSAFYPSGFDANQYPAVVVTDSNPSGSQTAWSVSQQAWEDNPARLSPEAGDVTGNSNGPRYNVVSSSTGWYIQTNETIPAGSTLVLLVKDNDDQCCTYNGAPAINWNDSAGPGYADENGVTLTTIYGTTAQAIPAGAEWTQCGTTLYTPWSAQLIVYSGIQGYLDTSGSGGSSYNIGVTAVSGQLNYSNEVCLAALGIGGNGTFNGNANTQEGAALGGTSDYQPGTGAWVDGGYYTDDQYNVGSLLGSASWINGMGQTGYNSGDSGPSGSCTANWGLGATLSNGNKVGEVEVGSNGNIGGSFATAPELAAIVDAFR
jgi:prepilin-type N-terminal cleavage/methylation domain-containing protein